MNTSHSRVYSLSVSEWVSGISFLTFVTLHFPLHTHLSPSHFFFLISHSITPSLTSSHYHLKSSLFLTFDS
ncbi:hypothetical protein Lalb_Chr19g0133941 [Lupinus albus]|uniref:Uncharacterized protein n=1 Tax=Lupinus albus TaxID=3870 RepID=A0A6A4NYB6_LUPAL|nr:hypothetical protein Lalb_Chr19g0133941 [Lupinus albus]